MRDLVVSVLLVVILIAGWLIYDSYAQNQVDSFTETTESTIIPLIETENWEAAKLEYEFLKSNWESFRKITLIFLENEQISEIDYSFARAEKYIEARDVSNSAGELAYIAEQFQMLQKREKIAFSNIF